MYGADGVRRGPCNHLQEMQHLVVAPGLVGLLPGRLPVHAAGERYAPSFFAYAHRKDNVCFVSSTLALLREPAGSACSASSAALGEQILLVDLSTSPPFPLWAQASSPWPAWAPT